MGFLDPEIVPTIGDWFRAGGYHTHWRGKWYISHTDLTPPGTHTRLMSCESGEVLTALAMIGVRITMEIVAWSVIVDVVRGCGEMASIG